MAASRLHSQRDRSWKIRGAAAGKRLPGLMRLAFNCVCMCVCVEMGIY